MSGHQHSEHQHSDHGNGHHSGWMHQAFEMRHWGGDHPGHSDHEERQHGHCDTDGHDDHGGHTPPPVVPPVPDPVPTPDPTPTPVPDPLPTPGPDPTPVPTPDPGVVSAEVLSFGGAGALFDQDASIFMIDENHNATENYAVMPGGGNTDMLELVHFAAAPDELFRHDMVSSAWQQWHEDTQGWTAAAAPPDPAMMIPVMPQV